MFTNFLNSNSDSCSLQIKTVLSELVANSEKNKPITNLQLQVVTFKDNVARSH